MSAKRRAFRIAGLLGAVALAALACAGAAAAQGVALGERRLDVTISGSAVYDSNVAAGSQAVADLRGIRRGDYIYSPNANLDISLPFGRQLVTLSGDIGYEFHQYNSQLKRERIGLAGGVRRPIGPCITSLDLQYGRAQTDLADLSLIVTRNTQENIVTSANVACQPLAGIGASVGAFYGTTTNSAPVGVVDSKRRGVNAAVSYSNSLLGTVALTGAYSTTDYSDPGTPDQFVPPGTNQASLTVSIVRPIGTRLTGTASLGYTRLRSDNGGQAFDGLTGSGALTYRVNPRLTASLTYRRAVQNTLLRGADYTLSESLSLNGSYRIGSRITATFGGQLTRGQQKGQLPTLVDTFSESRAKSVTGSLSTQIGRTGTLSINARYEVRNAKPTLFDYSSYRIGVTASQTF